MIRFLPKTLIAFTILTLFIISGVMVFRSSQVEAEQSSAWMDSIRKSILPQLVESDYIPLSNKIDLVRKTGLFEAVTVYNSRGDVVSSFGPSLKKCDKKYVATVLDDTGNSWGEICYTTNKFSALEVFALPFTIIATILLILSLILARAISIIIKNEDRRNQNENEKAQLARSIASQVAHDIRSPLAALEMVTWSALKNTPDTDRIIMENAMNRIKDIANNLLSNTQVITPLLSSSPLEPRPKQPEMVVPLVESVISETRVRLRNDETVDLRCNSSFDSRFGFVSVDSGEFKTILSNLINNAIESKNGSKIEICVSIECSNKEVAVRIVDNGKGIPKHILLELGSPGLSYGKESINSSGSGIGVPHAIKLLKAWNGRLTYESRENSGTTASILLPEVECAPWFTNKIEISKNTTVVICDDDPAIHSIWANRFQNQNRMHFNSLGEFRKFFCTNFEQFDNVFYLMDYNFIGEVENGLDVAIELAISSKITINCLLVTSYCENTNIRRKCQSENIAILPKSMSGFIPINVL